MSFSSSKCVGDCAFLEYAFECIREKDAQQRFIGIAAAASTFIALFFFYKLNQLMSAYTHTHIHTRRKRVVHTQVAW